MNMRYIILLIILMSISILSGCNFSLYEGGFYNDSKTFFIKAGSISSDLMIMNAKENSTLKFQNEEEIKRKGFIGGIFITKEF